MFEDWVIPEKIQIWEGSEGGWGVGGEDILYFSQNPLEIFTFVTLPVEKNFHLWKFWKLVWHPLEILRSKTKIHGNSTRFFLEHPWKFHFFFSWTLEFSYAIFSIPLKIPSGISIDLGFWMAFEFSKILWNFQGWSFIFCRISKSKVTKLKILGIFSKKYFLNLPCLDFFWNSSLFDYFGFDWDLQKLTII